MRLRGIIFGLLMVSNIGFAAQEEEKVTRTSSNIEVVKNYFESLRTGNLEALGGLLADDIVWHQPGLGQLSGEHRGKEQVFRLFGKFMEISQGTFKIDEVKNLMANQDFVSATLHFSASRNGWEISMDGVDLMRVKNGKIAEVYLFSADQDAEDAFWNEDK